MESTDQSLKVFNAVVKSNFPSSCFPIWFRTFKHKSFQLIFSNSYFGMFEQNFETWISRKSVRFFKWILCVIILCQAILSIYYIIWKSKLMTADPNGPYGIDMVELCFEIFILCWCLSILFFLLWRINTKMRLGMFSLIGWSAALFLVISLIMGIALYIMEKVAQVMVKVSPKEHVKIFRDDRNLSLDEFNFRWFENSVIDLGKAVSNYLMFNHLKRNLSYSLSHKLSVIFMVIIFEHAWRILSMIFINWVALSKYFIHESLHHLYTP